MIRRPPSLCPGAIERAANSLGWEVENIESADSFLARLGGLAVRSSLLSSGKPRIVAFPACDAIHTCFMRYPIDVAFIDRQGSVLVLCQGVAPWRFLSYPGAAAALERPSVLTAGPLCYA